MENTIKKTVKQMVVGLVLLASLLSAGAFAENVSAASRPAKVKELNVYAYAKEAYVSWKPMSPGEFNKIDGLVIYRNGRKIKTIKKNKRYFCDKKPGRKNKIKYTVKTFRKVNGKRVYSAPVRKTAKKKIVLESLYEQAFGTIYPVDRLDDPKEQGYDLIGFKWSEGDMSGYDGYAFFRDGKLLKRLSKNENTYIDTLQPLKGYTWRTAYYQVKLWKKVNGRYVYKKGSDLVEEFAGTAIKGKNGKLENVKEAWLSLGNWFTEEEERNIAVNYMKHWYPSKTYYQIPGTYRSGDSLFEVKKGYITKHKKWIKEMKKQKKAQWKEEEKERQRKRMEEFNNMTDDEQIEKVWSNIAYARSAADVKVARKYYNAARETVKNRLAGSTYADNLTVIDGVEVSVPEGSKWRSSYEELKIKEFALLYTDAVLTKEAGDIEKALDKWNSISDNYYGCYIENKIDNGEVLKEILDIAWNRNYEVRDCWERNEWKSRKEVMKPLYDNLIAISN